MDRESGAPTDGPRWSTFAPFPSISLHFEPQRSPAAPRSQLFAVNNTRVINVACVSSCCVRSRTETSYCGRTGQGAAGPLRYFRRSGRSEGQELRSAKAMTLRRAAQRKRRPGGRLFLSSLGFSGCGRDLRDRGRASDRGPRGRGPLLRAPSVPRPCRGLSPGPRGPREPRRAMLPAGRTRSSAL